MRPHRPSWADRILDGLLSREPKRRIRLVQTAIAILMTLSGLGVMQYIAWTGFADWSIVVPWTVTALAGYGLFYLAIRTGWSERFADPALTVGQMLYAIAGCLSAYAIAGGLRATVFPLLMVVLMFGMFSLTPRQVLAISALAVTGFGAVMVVMARRQPATFAPAVEWGHFLMLATMLPTASLLAGQLSQLRSRLQQQKRDLAEALERIQFLATRDDLTGLINRREMTALLHREWLRSQRSGASFCVAMIDLDHFKRINDSHGHRVGDEILRAFATEGALRVRAADALGRWGGEEFLLLFPQASLPSASEGAERLRRAIELMRVPVGQAWLSVTLSAGVVQHQGHESVEQLIERADEALYRAKSAGRNQVTCA